MVLIDCSQRELDRNLGRRTGRLDDTKEANDYRLKTYRQSTLPMLKALDDKGVLIVVRITTKIHDSTHS